MDPQSVFYREWLRSLREQYKHVAREDDRVTLSSLTAVMQQVGFRDDELARLRVEATMHVDEVGADFRADLNILEESGAAQTHPAECLCPDCVTIDESKFDADGQPLAPVPEADDDEASSVFPAADASRMSEPAEAEPVTFEDGVAAEADLLEAAQPEAAPDEDDLDPDAPAQMNLF